jgi:hypothetical protein
MNKAENQTLANAVAQRFPTMAVEAGEGERFQALFNPVSQRYVVIDTQRPGCEQPTTLAAGLPREDAAEAVEIANNNGRWSAMLTNSHMRATRAVYGFY